MALKRIIECHLPISLTVTDLKNIIVLHFYVKCALQIVTPDVLWWRLYNLSSIRQRNVIKAHLAWEEKSVNRKRVHAAYPAHAKWIEQAVLEDWILGCVCIFTPTLVHKPTCHGLYERLDPSFSHPPPPLPVEKLHYSYKSSKTDGHQPFTFIFTRIYW